ATATEAAQAAQQGAGDVERCVCGAPRGGGSAGGRAINGRATRRLHHTPWASGLAGVLVGALVVAPGWARIEQPSRVALTSLSSLRLPDLPALPALPAPQRPAWLEPLARVGASPAAASSATNPAAARADDL